jgi:hypothetical protein
LSYKGFVSEIIQRIGFTVATSLREVSWIRSLCTCSLSSAEAEQAVPSLLKSEGWHVSSLAQPEARFVYNEELGVSTFVTTLHALIPTTRDDTRNRSATNST